MVPGNISLYPLISFFYFCFHLPSYSFPSSSNESICNCIQCVYFIRLSCKYHHVIALRLPKLVLEVSKKMLTESSRNTLAVTVEKEAGWLLLSSLLASMPKEVCRHLYILNIL